VIVERDDTEQAHLCLGWRSLSAGDDDRWAMSVANQVLGGGMASRLFQEVREERGLAYSVYSHPTAFEDSGYLTIYCGTAPKRAREALDVIDDVVASVLVDGITDAELAVAAGYLEGSMLLGLEDSGGRMGRLGRSLMQRDRITTIDEHVERLRAVSASDVSRVLHRVLDGPRALAAVGPFEVSELVG
jgi:predicted Zn-dependent peptidase